MLYALFPYHIYAILKFVLKREVLLLRLLIVYDFLFESTDRIFHGGACERLFVDLPVDTFTASFHAERAFQLYLILQTMLLQKRVETHDKVSGAFNVA